MAYNPITGALLPQSPNIMKAVEWARPANTTQYTIGDAVAPATKAISASTNAAPAVLTCSAHGLATGDRVTISGAVTMTSINGDFVVTVLTSSTFKISTEAGFLTGSFVAGNGVYGGSGVFQKMLRLADVVPANGGSGAIVGARLTCGDAGVTTATFRLRFYNSPISQIADNAAFTLLYANRAKAVGDMALTTVITEGAGSDSAVVTFENAVPIPFVCDAARSDLFVQICAIGGYTPASAETFRLEITIRRDQVPGLASLSLGQ